VRDADAVEFLVSTGLYAIDCETSVQALAWLYGVRRWYDFWDVIYLPPAPLFAENVQPYFIQNDVSHHLPPSTFYCDFDRLRDGHRNHELALDRLPRAFRQAPEDTAVSNTWSNTWTLAKYRSIS